MVDRPTWLRLLDEEGLNGLFFADRIKVDEYERLMGELIRARQPA